MDQGDVQRLAEARKKINGWLARRDEALEEFDKENVQRMSRAEFYDHFNFLPN